MRAANQAIKMELRRLAESNSDILLPKMVVDAARPVKSPLHSSFEWDDTVAAEAYRLDQARYIIQVNFDLDLGKNLAPGAPPPREWTSLPVDRKTGGYRRTAIVLATPNLRRQLLDAALAEMQFFEQKYAMLKELADVFAAMRRVRAKPKAPSLRGKVRRATA